MPYVLSPKISHNSSAMWMEGSAYEKKTIYSISSGTLPPVNYDEHILRPHSLTHFETPAHTNETGKRLDSFYQDLNYFFGETLVIKLQGNKYESKGSGIFHWVISKEELETKLKSKKIPFKILISTDFYPLNNDGYHDPNYVLTLSQEAADYLLSIEGFHLYGTSWKSSDFNPGKPERPIHNTLFKKAGILENLDLKSVPEGSYFMTAFPLPLGEASESPVVPVLFTKEELANFVLHSF
jgi:arylformamidase